MITIRPAGKRLHTRIGCSTAVIPLRSASTSIAAHGFRALRAINETRGPIVRDASAYRDLEILSYVVAGTLRHETAWVPDSIVTAAISQLSLSAPACCTASSTRRDREPLHVLQIWMTPEQPLMPPSYARVRSRTDRQHRLVLIGSCVDVRVAHDSSGCSDLLSSAGSRQKIAYPFADLGCVGSGDPRAGQAQRPRSLLWRWAAVSDESVIEWDA